MPENAKDVSIAIMGSSVALGGLLLIFAGLLFTQAAAFNKDTTADEIIDRFRRAGKVGIWPFILSLLISGACVWLLVSPGPRLYLATWLSFIGLLCITGVYGAWVGWRLL